jgi:WD40 repeat protein
MLPAKHAAIIGIDAYGSGIAPLKSAAADARAVAAALERDHGYGSPHLLPDGDATGAAILRLLEETLPAAVDAESAVVFYYAGHGVALGDGSEGPEGFLLPQDARPGDESTWLPMERVRQAFSRLACRHLLVVLDCCFAGSFRWASSRSFVPVGRPLYDSQYERFLAGTAWQALTSASHQEKALDVAPGCRNTRDGGAGGHSPFAAALLRGLAGDADSTRGRHDSDGVMTATELHQLIFEELVPPGARPRQTPGIWPLKPENTGEFLFLVPGREKKTRPDPPLDDANNPWLGLRAYGGDESGLFFGRERVVKEILGRLLDPPGTQFLAVVGASGTGKSSVVRAGVLPRLAADAWTVVRLPRLQGDPRLQLDEALRQLAEVLPGSRKLLFIDQFEELYTQCPDSEVREGFLRRLRGLMNGEDPLQAVMITVRSDFEPRLAASPALGELLAAARYLVPAMTSEELRDVIEEPAKAKALYFEPEALVGDLVDEVMAMPGGLPLLSFALAEMYRQAQLRRRATGALDRALTRDDYAAAGGVVGALHRRANELYEAADPARRATIRRLFLRMVTQEGGRLARRRVEERELEYADPEEQARVRQVLADYVEARLLVADEGYVEPAHDTLVLAWERLLAWLADGGSQELVRQLWETAAEWEKARKEKGDKGAVGLLWNQDPRLPLVQDRYLGTKRLWHAPRPPARPGELNRLESELAARSVARKRSRRNLVVGITAGVILALSGATWYSLDSAGKERTAKQRAQDIARVAVAGEWLESDPTRAALVLMEVAKPDETASAVRRMRETLEELLSDVVLRGHQAPVRSAAFSPDGRRVVTASVDHTVRVWAADGSGEPVDLKGHEGEVSSAAFSPDGARIVTASEDGTARVWSADGSGKPVVFKHQDKVLSAAFSPDGARIVTASADHSARVWASDGSGSPVVLRGHESSVLSAAFSPDGLHVVTASEDGTARVWRAADGSVERDLVHGGPVLSAAFSPDGAHVVTVSYDHMARVWTAGSDEPVILRGHEGPVSSAAFSPDGKRVVTASDDHTARVWAADGSGQPLVLRGHQEPVLSAAFSSDGRRVVTASFDGTARVWAADDSGAFVVLRGHQDPVLGAVFSPDGRRVVTASADDTARVWTLEDLEEPVILKGHESWILSAVFSPDGRRVVTASWDKTARIWEADGSGEPLILKGHEGEVLSAAFSPDGRRVVTASKDRTARVWAADGAGELMVVFKGHQGEVSSAAFSSDGKRIVTASDDGTARVWRADGFGEPLVLEGHRGKVRSAAFSPDGRLVVTASEDRTARVWKVDSADKPVIFKGHQDDVWSAAFSPDGRRVVTASLDRTAQVWNADGSGKPIVLRNYELAVSNAVFSPDGTRILTSSINGIARVWPADGSSEPVSLRSHALAVPSAAFSPDGQHIIAASSGATRIWASDGSGEPIVLPGAASSAAFSPDGRRIVTTSPDHIARVWAVGGRLLQAILRRATAACLDPEFRINNFGESKDEAAKVYKSCRRCITSWRREVARSALRAAPDEAWRKWQECMSR